MQFAPKSLTINVWLRADERLKQLQCEFQRVWRHKFVVFIGTALYAVRAGGRAVETNFNLAGPQHTEIYRIIASKIDWCDSMRTIVLYFEYNARGSRLKFKYIICRKKCCTIRRRTYLLSLLLLLLLLFRLPGNSRLTRPGERKSFAQFLLSLMRRSNGKKIQHRPRCRPSAPNIFTLLYFLLMIRLNIKTLPSLRRPKNIMPIAIS